MAQQPRFEGLVTVQSLQGQLFPLVDQQDQGFEGGLSLPSQQALQ
jgi:hypothetical protein